MSEKHTPTPWSVYVQVPGSPPRIHGPTQFGRGSIGSFSRLEDAHRAVAAINAHDALVARVAELEAKVCGNSLGGKWTCPTCDLTYADRLSDLTSERDTLRTRVTELERERSELFKRLLQANSYLLADRAQNAALREALGACQLDAEIFRRIVADTLALREEAEHKVETLDAPFVTHAPDIWIVEGPDDNACRAETLIDAFRLAYGPAARAALALARGEA